MDFFNFLKNNKLFILITSVIVNILLIGVSSFLLYKSLNVKEENVIVHTDYETSNVENISNKELEYYVEIKGAVKNPGVYKLNSDSIINDLVKEANGFTKKAYTKNINLSRKISNELVVYVYTESEYKKLHQEKTIYVTKEVYIDTPCECKTYDISNCLDNGKSEIVASDKDTVFESAKEETSREADNTNLKVNINTATVSELQTLPGIGESKAKDIISYRTNNGLFKDTSEIKNVSGIGNALFEKIKDSITI